MKTDDRIYLILEYCNGGDLSTYINQHGRVSESIARHFMRQLGEWNSCGCFTLQLFILAYVKDGPFSDFSLGYAFSINYRKIWFSVEHNSVIIWTTLDGGISLCCHCIWS